MKQGKGRAALVCAMGLLVSGQAGAAPTVRHQVDQLGDFTLIGNTLGHDCGNGTPAPIVGTVGACGSSVSDSSPDVFWSADAPSAGQATASTSIGVAQARSTAVLTLPAGATVSYARLYWGAITSTGADTTVTFERPGVFSQSIDADVSHTLAAAPYTRYESSALITSLVQTHGEGAYRLGGADSVALPNLAESRAYAAWAMVVFYELAGEPLRQLTLFDGLDLAGTGSGVVADISGFLVPNTGIDAKLGVVAYGGDGQTGGDTLEFNAVLLTDGLAGGSTNNFFNGSRTWLGAPISTTGDLPQLSGDIRSLSAVDLDVVDVTAQVVPGSTSAQVVAKAGGDNNLLMGAYVTSITTYKPNFNDTIKSATDDDGGSLMVGDTITYTLDVVNTGNDPALDVVLEDALPSGVSYVPGSIEITSGANAGTKTDPTGDDQAEYDATTRTITVRLGAGADATTGGRMEIGETATIVFKVTIDAGTAGLTISNQATIEARGLNGAPTTTFQSDDGSSTGSPTDVVIDGCETDTDCVAPTPFCYDPPGGASNYCVECKTSADCPNTLPVCDAATLACTGCSSDADCTDPAFPACQTSGSLMGSCTECSDTNGSLCVDPKPLCLTSQGVCGCTDTDGDSECGGPNSGIICNGPAGVCVAGCSVAANRNDCPTDQYCSDQSGGVGTCSPQPCLTDGDCTAPQSICDTSQQPNVCVQCLTNGDCSSPLICDTADNTCVECTPSDTTNCSAAGNGAACLTDRTCGCQTDADCGATDSGRVCDPTSTCVTGCRGTGGNGCPSSLVCTSSDATIGSCVECVSDSDCPSERPLCDSSGTVPVCVGCIDDSDCPVETPVCTTTGTCTGCTSDADCSDTTKPACQTSGSLTGQCTECSATNSSLCADPKPECLEALGICGCSDSDGDSECGANDSGRICNGPVGECVDGCVIAVGRNGCPAVEYCSEQSGAVGECLTHCTTNDDCTVDPNLVCDTSGVPHVCVECVADTDCTDPDVCNDTHSCVECTATKLDNCTADGNGAACLDDETCGCLDDADCGASDSGRVCDTTSLCIEGCRGQGGNGCPSGEHCSSTTSEIGECVTDLPDAGPDGAAGAAGSAGAAGAAGSDTSDAGSDAPTADDSSAFGVEGGGCGCSVPGSKQRVPGGLAWLALGALVVLGRRRH